MISSFSCGAFKEHCRTPQGAGILRLVLKSQDWGSGELGFWSLLSHGPRDHDGSEELDFLLWSKGVTFPDSAESGDCSNSGERGVSEQLL